MGDVLMNTFKLEGKTPVGCSLQEWAEQLRQTGDRKVGSDCVLHMTVSTVFVGSDAGYDLEQERAPKKVTRKISWDDSEFLLQPYLFETMVFGWPQTILWKFSRRYQSWEDAREGHIETVELLRSSVNKILMYTCGGVIALSIIGKFITLIV